MSRVISRNRIIGWLSFAALALLSAAAAAGWVSRGEAIFLHMAESAWATCF